MADDTWPNVAREQFRSYQTDEIRHRLIGLFGTEHPVVWVTGSVANRVGRAVAKRFAMHGYQIALHGNRSIDQSKSFVDTWNEAGIETVVVKADISKEDEVADVVERIKSRFGRLDVLIHTAAVWEPKSLESTHASDVMEQFESNTLGSFLCGKYAGMQMVSQSMGGSIVLTGDWAVARPYSDFAAYFTSKGAIPTLTRTFAVELAKRNPKVRVNAVLPGPVMLPEGTPETKANAILQQSLLKSHGTADHVARTALFLAEHEFITGVCVPVDGGRSIYAGDSTDAIAHPRA